MLFWQSRRKTPFQSVFYTASRCSGQPSCVESTIEQPAVLVEDCLFRARGEVGRVRTMCSRVHARQPHRGRTEVAQSVLQTLLQILEPQDAQIFGPAPIDFVPILD